ncbi:MAG: S41 family peptidase [Salinivirgaceae bacterium]
MNVQTLIKSSLLLALFVIAASCTEPESPESDQLMVNTWISDVMNDYYFWYEKIPADKTPNASTDPTDYFYSLLYTQEDKWSYITDDYSGLMAEFSGTPVSMGYTPAFGQFSNTGNLFIIVVYVYKNSPAEAAGLKRGDIILKINNQELTPDNYRTLFSQEQYSVSLGTFDGSSISENNRTLNLTAQQITVDPILFDTIYQDYNGKNIAYFCLSEFLNKDPFVSHVQPVIEEIKSNGIGDVIIDLRYNSGGALDAAAWLASSLAPQTTLDNHSVLVELLFNNKLQPYMEQENETKYYFDQTVATNLNLDHIYFLTTNYMTASASELLITGLEPYMEVIQVGENTVGKYTGMWAIPDLEKPARHNYGIMPIVMKYANAVGYTDFKDGLIPDHLVEDNLLTALPLGHVDDPQIATALNLIAGLVGKKHSMVRETPPFILLNTPDQELKSNLFLKPLVTNQGN